jgi:hypothetical protein
MTPRKTRTRASGLPGRTLAARMRLGPALAAAGLVLAGVAASSPALASAPAARPAAGHAHASIRPAPDRVVGAAAGGQPGFGPNVYVFTPDMPQSQIQATVDAIAAQQVPNQFGTQRYALLFEPGTYGTAADPLIFGVGYYTEVAGLGLSPGDVVINGSADVLNQCFAPDNCIALNNFWRSLSNLTINVAGLQGCQASTEFWAVSQAAPMRRVAVNGLFSLMDYCSAGPQFASGGFIADSAFRNNTIVNGSQQQFIVRNSSLDGWSNGVWNQVFVGDPGAPPQSFSATSGLPGGTAPYTTLDSSPVTQEEPFLTTGPGGSFRVFVPSLQHNSAGPSWSAGSPGPGTSLPLSQFFIASPATRVAAINLALLAGKNLILSPGVYHLSQTILVSRPHTIVLGLGFPTLVPEHGITAMNVAAAAGTKLSGMIFDAGPVSSRVLLQVGDTPHGNPAQPTLVQDVFFRIGGATAGKAATSLVVNSSDVILDDIWAWRADHGTGVGWTANTADTGLVVNGDNVTAYGLFVEHFQKTEVIWNGQHGEDIFFQNEMPYDPPDQASWRLNASTPGYPAFTVTPRVRTFTGYGLASYSFFNQGVPIESANAFTVPAAPGVQLHDLLTRFLNGSGSIDHVINGTGAAVTAASPGPSDVVSYP